MSRRLTAKRLAELQAQSFPVATLSDEDIAGLPLGTDVDALREHLSHFIATPDDKSCPGCGEPLGFTWRIEHGLGECWTCGYLVQVYHYTGLPEGSGPFRRCLAFQPAELSIGTKESA